MKAFKLAAVLAALVLLSVSCRDKKAKDNAATQTADAKKQTEQSTTRRSTRTNIPTASAAYFGKPDRPMLTEPLQFEKNKNSVLLIVADALNVKHLSTYGYHRKTSPNIDRLADEGVLFTNHVSNSSWTRPSYTTIITGLTKDEHGVELRGGWRLKESITTLAERFKAAGYRRAGYTGNPLVRKSWGFDQGYEEYEGPTTLGLKAFPWDRIFVDKALDWLKKIKTDPFFLSLFLTAPHPPYRPPKIPRTFLSTVAPGAIIEHPHKEYKKPLPKDDHDRILAAYDDEIAYMDKQIGRLLDYLKETGRDKDTTIVFTADHGEMFGEHNCYLHAYHMWEQTLRVPLIIKSPNIKDNKVAEDTPFTHIDLAPTIMDLANIPYGSNTFKGLSVVKEAGRGRHGDRIRFSQYNAHGVRRQAVRKEGLKLVHHHKVEPRAAKDLDELHPGVPQADPKNLPSLAWDKERYELFDLINDPEEKTDLFGQKETSEKIKPLMQYLSSHLGSETPTGEISPELLEALKAAGYILDDSNPSE